MVLGQICMPAPEGTAVNHTSDRLCPSDASQSKKSALRQIDVAVNYEKLYEIVEPLYSEGVGRHGVDPVVLFKIVLLQHLDGNTSLGF